MRTNPATALEVSESVGQLALGTREQMGAGAVLAMLEQRHSGDVFVSECKDGPTQTRAHRRLDAWALLKTWSPITTIGYEIKVSRGDWLKDNKIHDYMPLCHLLYVVAPKGIVSREELPAGVGLMEPIGTAGRLQTRQKAARREIALPAELMVYVLMCRAKVTREVNFEDPGWKAQQLRRWVEEKGERKALSYHVSSRIQETFREQERRIEQMEQRCRDLERIEKRIAELGFDPNEHASRWRVEERLREIAGSIDTWMLTRMESLSRELLSTRDALQRLKSNGVSVETVTVDGAHPNV